MLKLFDNHHRQKERTNLDFIQPIWWRCFHESKVQLVIKPLDGLCDLRAVGWCFLKLFRTPPRSKNRMNESRFRGERRSFLASKQARDQPVNLVTFARRTP